MTVILFIALVLLLSIFLINRRRRQRGLEPLRGTAWGKKRKEYQPAEPAESAKYHTSGPNVKYTPVQGNYPLAHGKTNL